MGRSKAELRLGIVQGLTSHKHTSLGGSRNTYVSDLFVRKGYRVLEMSEYIVCPSCGEAFHEDEVQVKKTWSYSNCIGYGGGFPDYTYICPKCGAENDPCDWEESRTCELCGEPSGDEDICEYCKEDFFGQMDEFFTEYAEKHGCDDATVYDLIEAYLDR